MRRVRANVWRNVCQKTDDSFSFGRLHLRVRARAPLCVAILSLESLIVYAAGGRYTIDSGGGRVHEVGDGAVGANPVVVVSPRKLLAEVFEALLGGDAVAQTMAEFVAAPPSKPPGAVLFVADGATSVDESLAMLGQITDAPVVLVSDEPPALGTHGAGRACVIERLDSGAYI